MEALRSFPAISLSIIPRKLLKTQGNNRDYIVLKTSTQYQMFTKTKTSIIVVKAQEFPADKSVLINGNLIKMMCISKH